MTRKNRSEANTVLPAVDRGHTYPMPLWLQVIRWLCTTLLVSVATNGGVLLVTVIVMIALVEADAFSLPYETRDALDAFSRRFIGVSSLGGMFGLAVVYAVVHDVFWALLRRHLSRFTDGDHNLGRVPVGWQRASYVEDGDKGRVYGRYPGLTILGGFSLILGPLTAIVAIVMIVGDDDREFAIGALLVGVAMAVVPIVLGAVLALFPRSAASRYWGSRKAGTFAPRDKEGTPSEQVAGLARISRASSRVLGVVSAVALGSFLLTALATFIVQPCRGCEPRDLSEQGQGVVAFLAGSAGLVITVTIVILLLAVLVEATVSFRLRQRLLREAADPEGQPPPWPVLNGALNMDAPLTGFFILCHVVGLISLEIGVTGLLLDQDVVTIDDGVWWLLCRVGFALIAVGAVFWWYRRDQVAQERELLMERWG